MTFFMIFVNVSLTSDHYPLFEYIYGLEFLGCLIIVCSWPHCVYIVSGLAGFHRNLRLILVSVVVHAELGTISRAVLLYYQISHIPLDDNDVVLMAANMIRESFYGYIMAINSRSMDAVKGMWQSVVNTKKAYLNPHEHFGRANICRAALASYVGIYFLFKWNQSKKAAALAAEKQAQKKAVAYDALARAGLA